MDISNRPIIRSISMILEKTRKRKRVYTEESEASEPPVKRYLHSSKLTGITPTFVDEPLSREHMVRLRETWLCIVSQYETHKVQFEENKDGAFKELYRALRIRELAIAQLTLDNLDEEMQEFCINALTERRELMVSMESEFSHWNDLLETRNTAITFANQLAEELDDNIRRHDEAMEHGPVAEFKRLTSLNLIQGIAYPNLPKFKGLEPPLRGAFTFFKRFPAEIRQLIWKHALPGPRILTHSAKHNQKLGLMGVCREAREVARLNYVRLHRPHHGPNLLENPARILYANLDIDTVVIDITAPQTEESGSDILDRSLFDLPDTEFMTEIYTRFVGLSRVKHLALAFNVTHDNGGALFIALQAACPELRTLTVFPNSQMHVAEQQQDRLWGEDELHFVEVDSNLTDYEFFRHDILPSRRYKQKSFRGLEILYQLEDVARQYRSVFPEHIRKYSLGIGQKWNPTARLCLLSHWNKDYNGFETIHLQGDEYWKGYPGEDGLLCDGFLESGAVCDVKGEVFSRYDGLKRLFDEEE